MADVAKGTTFDWGGTSIAGVTDFGGPSVSAAAIDVTDLSSANKQFLQDVEDSGEITLTMNFEADNTNQTHITTGLTTETTRVFTIQFQNGTAATTEWSCNAFVTSFSPGGAVAGQLTADATFKFTGLLTVG